MIWFKMYPHGSALSWQSFADNLFGDGCRRMLSPGLARVCRWGSVIAAVYIFSSFFLYPQQIQFRGICLGFFLALSFITYTPPGAAQDRPVSIGDWLLVGLSFSVSGYMSLNLERIVTRYPFVDAVQAADIGFCILTVFLLVAGTRRIVGPWLPMLSILSVGYVIIGPWLPGLFRHPGFSAATLVDELFLTTDGIWGSMLGIAAGNIMVFVLFGAFLLNSGISGFLYEFAASVAGASRGGLAKVAILSSALFGMISGNSVANTSTMGVLTIPLMKKSGYPADFAAAVECCASIGGILMPPIMGSVAFILAEVLGIPYIKVAQAAFLPAVLYFTAIFIVVDVRASQLGLIGISRTDLRPARIVLREGILFIVPIIYLVIRMLMGVNPSRVGLESILVTVIVSWLRVDTRMGIRVITNSLSEGIQQGTMIVTTMAICGVMIGVINLTGIASKLSSFLMAASANSLFGTLALVMLVTMFLGLAMNITPAYLLTAVIAAPVLIGMGVTPMAAHLFILFYAAMATMTPPVALTAFVAAMIAEAPPMRVGFLSMRIAFPSFILPFVFVYSPQLLMQGSLQEILLALAAALLSVLLITLGMEGWFQERQLGKILRGILVTAGIAAMTGNLYLGIAAAFLLLIIFKRSRIKSQFIQNDADQTEVKLRRNIKCEKCQ